MEAGWYKGGTRLLRVGQVAVVGLMAVAIYDYDPDVEIDYIVDGPHAAWRIDDNMTCVMESGSLSSLYPGISKLDDLYRNLDGIPVRARLCFRARRADSGQMVIPVSEEPDGRWAGWPADNPDTLKYAQAMATIFAPSAEVEQKATATAFLRHCSGWRSMLLRTLGIGLGLIVALEGLWRLFAWIVKGFVGGSKKEADA